MPDRSFLGWPFFDEDHRRLAEEAGAWAARELAEASDDDVDARAGGLVRSLGAAGWTAYVVPASHGGARETVDVRSVCLLRETFARHDGLADAAFAMQGLGSLPISLFGSSALRDRYLRDVATGKRVCAFALSEPDAGSDVAALRTTARREGDGYVLDGTKTWISNAGIADQYVVFARTGEDGAKGLSAFVVDADARGLDVVERIRVIAPHPLGTLRFDRCRVAADRLLGREGDGFRVAMATLDLFRPTVGAAALGFARRALDEATARVKARTQFGQTLDRFQLVQERIAQMALDVDASALLVYRAAWAKDSGAERITREASMAKLYATEAAQRVADTAVQLFGGLGVTRGVAVERLYREVRALRIYEGTSEIQSLVIAGQVLRD
ncbi:MAG: acyl-CoA dehydrogenase family protein [Chloroflexota bacterium]|nr:acyl-CoA dehydrogenase family protein [Chloroflexota bacterium]